MGLCILFVQLSNHLLMDNFRIYLSSQRRKNCLFSSCTQRVWKRYNLIGSHLLAFSWRKIKFIQNWANSRHKTWLMNLPMTLCCRFSATAVSLVTLGYFVCCSYLLNNHIHTIVVLNKLTLKTQSILLTLYIIFKMCTSEKIGNQPNLESLIQNSSSHTLYKAPV